MFSQNFSKSYLHHLTKNNEILSSMILSLHNIAFYMKMMSDIRQSIIDNDFQKIKNKYSKYHEKYKKNLNTWVLKLKLITLQILLFWIALKTNIRIMITVLDL